MDMTLDTARSEPADLDSAPLVLDLPRLPVGYSEADFEALVDRFLDAAGGARAPTRDQARAGLLAVLVTSTHPLPPLPIPAVLADLHDRASRGWGLGEAGVITGGAFLEATGEPSRQLEIARFTLPAGQSAAERDANTRLALGAVRYVRALIDRQRKSTR